MNEGHPFLDQVWRLFSSNFVTKIVSVVIAVVLWGVVLGSRNVEVTKEIPLEIITPPDIVAANEIPDKIAFRLSGPKAFLRTILDRREEPIRVNLSGAKPALVTYRFFSDNIRVPIGVKVLSINPTAILIKLEYLKKKDVPIRLDLKGSSPEGFRITKTEINPEVVRIKGAESRVDAITELVTTPIDISSFKKKVEKEAPLDLSRYNVQLESAVPKVVLDVEPISANFRVKNIDIRVLSPYKSKLLEDKSVSVLIRATPQDIETLDRSQIYGFIDVRGKPKGTYNEAVKVSLPKNMGLVKVVPDHVGFILY